MIVVTKKLHTQVAGTNEPAVTLQLALEHGLIEDEYNRIIKILGREPTYTELGIFSVMWSEHCSYKNSILLLKTLPRTGGRLLVGAGEENAGLVDIGDGLAIAFKIESHNHPSAVEPYQGAATGVGGIMRDIFTMGARPIAALNSLRFGNLKDERVKYLFKQVVKGIGDYGNSFGVPTVGGEVYFDDCYRDNPLVNAMAVGIVEKKNVARAIAYGEGNLVMIVGSATGRDGIHGATFASEELNEKSESKRPSVQVGDPFTEKLLLEATLEAIREKLIIGIQDMGAAGLTCSSAEMSAKGSSGMRLDLDKVPLRESGMTSYEIMLSESQERMLLVVDKVHERRVKEIFEKWDLAVRVIGKVESSEFVNVFVDDRLEARFPASSLVLGGGAPAYERDAKEPAYLRETRGFRAETMTLPEDYNKVLFMLLGSANIASKRWVTRQYDSMVRTNSVENGLSDAAIVRIKGTSKSIAMTTDCNARYVYLNPRRGAQIAVAEAARNVVCTGAKPIGITNCLNFGNPYDPEVYWQFREAVLGIGEACRVMDTPVTGGNVSFYNESPSGSVFPTPVIGMLGLIEDSEIQMTAFFKNPGDVIVLLGRTSIDVGGSEYLYQRVGSVTGNAPEIDLEYERRLHDLCLDLIGRRLIKSAHDVSEGGLATALVECCIGGKGILGATCNQIPFAGQRKDFVLFGEGQSRIVVTTTLDNLRVLAKHAAKHTLDYCPIGEVTEFARFAIGTEISVSLKEAREVYEGAIPAIVAG
jgi:phosphoribosylformylglycinamidine synthase II